MSSDEQINSAEPERISFSAIKYDGVVYTGAFREGHIGILQKLKSQMGANYSDSFLEEEGFVTSSGRFVGRKEARTIAENAKQIHGGVGDVLYSQNLWIGLLGE